jgi:hypothetical protein
MKTSEAYDEAMRRIEEAFEEEAYALDLGDLRLKELPKELGNLTELESLTYFPHITIVFSLNFPPPVHMAD